MSVFSNVARFRKPLLMAADFIIFSGGYYVAWFILMRRIPLEEYLRTMVLGYGFFIVIFFAAFLAFGMYESLWRYAEAYEFLKCMLATIAATVIFIAVTWAVFPLPGEAQRLPITVYFISALMAGGGSLFLRTAYRAFRANKAARRGGNKRKKVLVVGASETGVAVIQGLARNPGQRYEVVCAVDDDPAKIGRRIGRVPVSGLVQEIPKLTERHGIQVILLAIPHVSTKERRRISGICAKTTCELKKVPDIFDFKTNEAEPSEAAVISRIEDVSVEDLLGRDIVDIRRYKVKYLAGRTVLITGAGGTIGSELCRQAAAHGAARIIMVDIYENSLYAIEQELIFKFGSTGATGATSAAAGLEIIAEVANIREEERVDRIFAAYKPHLVYHAAAHKHVPLMEASPEEAVKNNIFGTLNVARCAEKHGVKRFVLISSDKAVNPTNIYGATKRVCEMIVQALHFLPGAAKNTEFAAVRFGNVLGSNGSVIPLFKAQIAAGGPLRVMHKEIIRYFMTVSEAVSLVMSAGEMAKGGEIFVLDMGEPVKILDLAEMLIRLSGLEPYKDINIEITNLRPGEKLYEELLMAEEGLKTTSNNKIFVGRPIDIKPEYLFEVLNILKKAAETGARQQLSDKLHELVPGFDRIPE
ncbi:MAG: polysaccharide biosynthesis protein [Defluviitaleaceae bacterium]|nr:polysaccharide biosynthesis protein [Defluviitaleaceae bacterium]